MEATLESLAVKIDSLCASVQELKDKHEALRNVIVAQREGVVVRLVNLEATHGENAAGCPASQRLEGRVEILEGDRHQIRGALRAVAIFLGLPALVASALALWQALR